MIMEYLLLAVIPYAMFLSPLRDFAEEKGNSKLEVSIFISQLFLLVMQITFLVLGCIDLWNNWYT